MMARVQRQSVTKVFCAVPSYCEGDPSSEQSGIVSAAYSGHAISH